MFWEGNGRIGHEIEKGTLSKFPWVSLAANATTALYYGQKYGYADGRAVNGEVQVGLTLGAAAAGAAMGAAAPAAAAVGVGWLAGEGINELPRLITHKTIGEMWGDSTSSGRKLDAITQESDQLTIHKGMSQAEVQARADKANELDSEARDEMQKTKSPVYVLKSMFGFN